MSDTFIYPIRSLGGPNEVACNVSLSQLVPLQSHLLTREANFYQRFKTNKSKGAPMRTNLDRAVERILQVFGALSGFALVKFITTPLQKEPPDPILLWSLAIALAALILRFILGSAIHLNQRFVNKIGNRVRDRKIICLFTKDCLFLLAFGLIAVGLTLCESVNPFIFWSMVFVGLGFLWGIVDWVFRRVLNELKEWGVPEKPWLTIDLIQFAFFLWFFFAHWPHATKALAMGCICIVFLIADIVFIVREPEVAPAGD
jgi:hypothetical protein